MNSQVENHDGNIPRKKATPTDLFFLSDRVSELTTKDIAENLDSYTLLAEKVSYILGKKQEVKEFLSHNLFKNALSGAFYVDGATKLSADDLETLRDLVSPVLEQSNEAREKPDQYIDFEKYLSLLKKDFLFTRGNEIIFRNPKYYFLFDSVGFSIEDALTSINDFKLSEIDINRFALQVLAHYNTIHQHLLLFSKFYLESLRSCLNEAKTEFQAEINTLLSTEELSLFKDLLKSPDLFTGIAQFDELYHEQWDHTISALEELRELVNNFAQGDSDDALRRIVQFLSIETVAVEHAKIELGIDVDSVFNKYFTHQSSQPLKKVLLGLLDAKINILAFCQNTVQIFSSDQFLNPDFTGSLVFSQSQVKHLSKITPELFQDFKKFQHALIKTETSMRLLREVDENVGYYMDVLMEDNNIGCIKLFGNIPDGTPTLNEEPDHSLPSLLRGALSSLYKLFSMIEEYTDTCEANEEIRVTKKLASGKTAKKSEAHLHLRSTAIRKLIRIYREENDPLVMIKTAQNALNHIIEKGFNSDYDVLHIMSVNYGGCLVGSFAKHTFARTIKRGRILCNPGNLVYSIYDVRNANSFSRLSDYPFSRILRDESVNPESKINFYNKNWLLAFDDNTNSGQTLDDIRILAEQSGFYSRIDLFPCRASSRIENYRKEIPEEFKLSMMANCAIVARKSSLNPHKIRYKEKLGTIIGNRMFKIFTERP